MEPRWKMAPELDICSMWLELSTTLKYMFLSPVCFHGVHTSVFSYTQKQGSQIWGVMRATPEMSSRRTTPLAVHFKDTKGFQNLLTHVTCPPCTTNSVCHVRRQVCSSWQIKRLHSKPNCYCGVFQTLAESFKRDRARAISFPQQEHDHPAQLSRVWALLLNHRRTPLPNRNAWILRRSSRSQEDGYCLCQKKITVP